MDQTDCLSHAHQDLHQQETSLYGAANVMLTRYKGQLKPKDRAFAIGQAINDAQGEDFRAFTSVATSHASRCRAAMPFPTLRSPLAALDRLDGAPSQSPRGRDQCGGVWEVRVAAGD